MESTTTTREAKLLRRNPSDHHDSGGGGGNDLISHLSDDILAHILASLPSMTDVMRACAVSRRWRHLGARVPVLRFFCLDHDFSEQEKLDRFIAFVNNILARRADDGTSTTVVEELEISFKLFNSRCMSGGSKRVVPSVDVAQVDAWIQYGMQHVSKSFTLQLNYMLPLNLHNSNSSNGCMQVLGSNKLMITCGGGATRLESMVLSLNKACLRRLPTNVTLDSLVHLTLEDVDDLNQLLSTARCPSLRKLCLHKQTVSPATTTDQSLHLESNELLKVSLDWIWSRALVLELRTPRLRVFHTRNASIGRLVISAPRLEELTFFYTRVASIVQVEDMPCVRIFETEMSSLRRPECNDHVNQTRIRLLRCCKFLQFLTLHLTITQVRTCCIYELEKFHSPWKSASRYQNFTLNFFFTSRYLIPRDIKFYTRKGGNSWYFSRMDDKIIHVTIFFRLWLALVSLAYIIYNIILSFLLLYSIILLYRTLI